MISRILTPLLGLALILITTACAGPDSLSRAPEPTSPVAEPYSDAPIVMAPEATPSALVHDTCDDPGDGIGGTGCAID